MLQFLDEIDRCGILGFFLFPIPILILLQRFILAPYLTQFLIKNSQICLLLHLQLAQTGQPLLNCCFLFCLQRGESFLISFIGDI